MFQNPKFWLGAVSALGVALVVVKDGRRTAPGDLAAVHQREDDLSSRSGCAQCHGDGDVRMVDACIECHADVGSDIDVGRGLHGSLEQNLAQQCAVCHSEHHGTEFPVVNPRSFFIAGVPDVEDFDHEIVGFPMAGEHLELLCIDCHANANDVVLPKGVKRYMGLDRSCAACHEDPHDGQMAKDCADCHSQETFDELLEFEHDERFPLVGSHARASCLDCHAEGSAHSIEASGGDGGPQRWRECVDCHESPHRESFIDGIAQLADLTPGDSCVTCHALEHQLFASESVEVDAEQHALSGFPLELPHAEVECAQCHGDPVEGASDFAARYPGRLPDDCQDCHDDAHRGFFADRAIDLGLAQRTECIDCHLPTTFSEIEPESFDHAHWTAFALLGAHGQAACKSCHPMSKHPDDLGRRFGRAAEHFGGRIEGCGTCHSDPHEGQFDREDLPASLDGRIGCARCHNETSFRSFPHGFDHGQWTGFALDGNHAEQSCSSCHRPHRPDAVGRTWGRAPGTNCADCHDDTHGGQFADENGETSCRACHEDTNDFTNLDFNHNRDSRFPLDETHRKLDCAQCHRSIQSGSIQITRYKPMGRECIDCHGGTRSRVRTRGRKG